MKRKIHSAGGSLVVLLAMLIVLSSCSRQVAPRNASTFDQPDTTSKQLSVAARPIPIDTVAAPLSGRKPSSVDARWHATIEAKMAALYRGTAYNTVWFHDNRPTALYHAARIILMEAGVHGLDPDAYDAAPIEQRARVAYQTGADAQHIAGLDLEFSEIFLLFTTHLTEGRVTSVANGKSIWKRSTPGRSLRDAEMLALVTSPDELNGVLLQLQPQHEQYTKLQRALVYHRSLEDTDNDRPVSIPSPVKPGERSIGIPHIRTRLSHLGYTLDATATAGMVTDSLWYDPQLADAVRAFQLRHGLTADGVIGERTLRFLNQRVADKAAVIALNMDRLRWMPAITAERYIVVNIPDYKLTVYEGKQRTMEMRVIVGSPGTPTPVFNDQLNHIVFSPTWTVPVSIVRNEIIPNLRRDSSYYVNKNFVIFKQDVEIDPALENWKDPNINPYLLRVVQNPGTDNSLGAVKFMMPNNMSVYLHDTPGRRLFAKEYRALSHGCIRLHEPAKLAEYLLKDQQGWNAERIAKAMNDSAPATILLRKKFPVHLVYQTAWVDDNGDVQFREDIYGHDRVQLGQLLPSTPHGPSAVSVSVAGK